MIARVFSAAQLELVRDFVLEALRTDPLVERPELAFGELLERVTDSTCGVFLGARDQELSALLICDANKSEFSRAVVVVHIYNTGGLGMLRALFRAMEGFKNEHGLERVHGIDVNQRPHAYCRLFRLGAWRPVPVGMFYQFSEVH